MVMIFKDTYEDLTPERLEEIIDAFEAGKGNTIKPGPQIDRIHSAPDRWCYYTSRSSGDEGRLLQSPKIPGQRNPNLQPARPDLSA